MLKVEFHSHTNYIQKHETTYSPKELIDKAKEMGYDVLCITEHYFLHPDWPLFRQNPFRSYEDSKDYAKKKGLLLIRGVEVRFKEGEVVLINYNGDLSELKDISDLKKLPEDVLVMASHPFFLRPICLGEELEKNIGLFDTIEWCHFYLNWLNRNLKAKEVAERHNKPMLATSDAHRFYQMNRCYTLVDAEKDPKEIVKAVKQRKMKIVTNPMPLHLFMWMSVVSVLYASYSIVLNKAMMALGINPVKEP